MDRFPELDDAVQNLSEDLDHRLVVIDRSMRVVSYSMHESPEDRRRLFHILAHSDSWPHPRTATTPYQVVAMEEIGPVLFLRMLDSRKYIIGHLVLSVTNQEAEQSFLARLDSAIARLSELLAARQHDAMDREARSYHLAAQLVSADTQSREKSAEALISERFLSSSEGFCAVALGIDPRDMNPLNKEKSAQAVASTLRYVRENSTATVIGGVLDTDGGIGVLVFPRPVVVPRLRRILEDPQLAPVRAGIGPLVPLAETHRSFERACLAWRASWLAPENHGIVTTWEHVGLDGTLARLPLEDFTPEDLPSAIRDLLSATDSPVLLDTLEAYLVAGGDAQQTARTLNIHRSTLYYRLDKLRNLIPGDFHDGILRNELHTGLRMARLAGLLKN
ncbi:PucR family transcriptional regulator [Corynebacterium crudilactis]|uniref:PucR family transcriptional regulator n=2 Tax=Corynebacterium crudilactis TaxID=1652495 RepID=A0A172QXK5_9CORY|nr:PucR family transcriptional regulator [Corynebacterium crudilactis]